jgi:hypothetical protein
VLGDRLLAEDVERRRRDLARVERVLQILVDQQRPARDVQHADAVLHLRERLGVEPVLGIGRLRQVDRDEVGGGVELVAGLGALDAQFAEALLGDVGVEREHPHPEPLGAFRDELADAAEAEHPEHLVVQLDAAELRPLPGAGGQ